ncbi:FliM/FliN family flagellar motor switch protein [Patulibacter sp. SYSU D01012]|uniref:FliM/FliN family flagellar motor switch protein n=1 Tax=Patulibacter sp. SYSU D01012 TaxID=2817381 RepID=UPI001B311C53|nr:FliM/FliN family flagellar motor switch protein [Patulibacter sp. SYSU D01012]
MSAVERGLRELGAVAAEAAADALRVFVPDGIVVGEIRALEPDTHPLAGVAFPAVATDVGYVDGVTGGNVFVMPGSAARRLAQAMMGMPDADDTPDDPLDEMEQSAVGEAMNQMMAAAAAATSAALETDVDISPPRTKHLATPGDADGLYEPSPHATTIAISVLGQPCRLVQLVPNAMVVRMTRALEERGSEITSRGSADDQEAAVELTVHDLLDVDVDVWVELGRTRMPAGQLVATPSGGVLALDRMAEDPVDLYVGGLRFGTARLVVVDGSEWAVRIETVNGIEDTREKES